MPTQDWKSLAAELDSLLRLQSPPLAITFSSDAPQGVPRFESNVPEPTPDGRTGKVPAGCVFWMEAAKGTFTTVAEDHGNCSVGSLTHGLKTLEEVAGNSDVAALLESGWVTMDMVPKIPVVKERPEFISYGPLEHTGVNPDVVLLRVNAKQAMVLSDAVPGLRFEGKPQCHIIPMAKEQNEIAVSVGCMLSRVRTGLSNNEMTCAIPASRLAEVIGLLKAAAVADSAVAAYASQDAQRFGR
ncbi:MAG TPA: DUF169 domain-containing protein [Blastocatellia bacterium]|jgi:uncharacterized protein (DUF169 family)|nr:DUF169 domain-containing protein [Blastocatellia bacterium]